MTGEELRIKQLKSLRDQSCHQMHQRDFAGVAFA